MKATPRFFLVAGLVLGPVMFTGCISQPWISHVGPPSGPVGGREALRDGEASRRGFIQGDVNRAAGRPQAPSERQQPDIGAVVPHGFNADPVEPPQASSSEMSPPGEDSLKTLVSHLHAPARTLGTATTSLPSTPTRGTLPLTDRRPTAEAAVRFRDDPTDELPPPPREEPGSGSTAADQNVDEDVDENIPADRLTGGSGTGGGWKAVGSYRTGGYRSGPGGPRDAATPNTSNGIELIPLTSGD